MVVNFPIWINEAIELREKKFSYGNIAKLIGVSKKSVSFYLKEKGYGPNEKYIRNIQKQPNKKYFDDTIFEKIDSEKL